MTKSFIAENQGEFPVFSGQTLNNGLMGSIDSYEFFYVRPVIFVTTVGAKAMSTRLVTGKFSLSQNCALIIPRKMEVSSQYFEGVLSDMFEFERRSISQIMQPSLRFDDLNTFRVPFPPLCEQNEIEYFLNEKTELFDNAIKATKQSIEFLRERRTALISAAVTGKIDVREWEAPATYPECKEPEEMQMAAEPGVEYSHD